MSNPRCHVQWNILSTSLPLCRSTIFFYPLDSLHSRPVHHLFIPHHFPSSGPLKSSLAIISADAHVTGPANHNIYTSLHLPPHWLLGQIVCKFIEKRLNGSLKRGSELRSSSKQEYSLQSLSVEEILTQILLLASFSSLDVRGSVHHSTIHKEKSNKMQQCNKFYYSIFI
jgi:hypothetical protein